MYRGMYRQVIEEVADLRAKNQVTIPKAVARAMGLRSGDRLVFIVDDEGSNHAHLYRIPKTFAGIAPHAYGGPGSARQYLEAEREGWDD